MLDFTQLAVNYCQDLAPLIRVIKTVISLIQWAIPIALILFGTIDLGKAVISSDEKEVKKAQSTLIKRVIYAVAIFFLALLVTLIMNIVSASGVDSKNGTAANSWYSCWSTVK